MAAEPPGYRCLLPLRSCDAVLAAGEAVAVWLSLIVRQSGGYLTSQRPRVDACGHSTEALHDNA